MAVLPSFEDKRLELDRGFGDLLARSGIPTLALVTLSQIHTSWKVVMVSFQGVRYARRKLNVADWCVPDVSLLGMRVHWWEGWKTP